MVACGDCDVVMITSRSLELVEDVLGIVERLRLNQDTLLLYLLQDGQQVLLHLLLDSLLKLSFHFLAVFEPFQLFLSPLDDLFLDQVFNSLVDCRLQRPQVYLLLSK